MENIEMQSKSIKEIYPAFAKAQAMIKPAIRDAENEHRKSKYADITSVWEACRDAIFENGMMIIQTMDIVNGTTILITTLAHISGEYIRSICPISPSKTNDSQVFGACVTYMRRYAITAMLGVCPEDRDGEVERLAAEKEAEARKKLPRPELNHVVEFEAILEQCSDDFKENIKIYMERKNWSSYYDFDLGTFNKIIDNAKANAERYKAALQSEAK